MSNLFEKYINDGLSNEEKHGDINCQNEDGYTIAMYCI